LNRAFVDPTHECSVIASYPDTSDAKHGAIADFAVSFADREVLDDQEDPVAFDEARADFAVSFADRDALDDRASDAAVASGSVQAEFGV
jgi:hypothetical protein